MSEEYTPERSYSAFWPILIFLTAFAISCFYQLYEVSAHRHYLQTQFSAAQPDIKKAEDTQARLVALMNDLLSTATKDANAAQIIHEAKQAGIIRERQAGDTNAAPAAATNP
jgi:hypothetical protein